MVIIDLTKYLSKCLSIITTKQLSGLGYDPTSKLESNV